jgi:hypothetical protein
MQAVIWRQWSSGVILFSTPPSAPTEQQAAQPAGPGIEILIDRNASPSGIALDSYARIADDEPLQRSTQGGKWKSLPSIN